MVMDEMKMITNSEGETFELGVKIGTRLYSGAVVSLNGDLGAGKTQLVKGIAKGLGIAEYVTSPSFTIVNEYEGRLPLYHFDVYRIEEVDEMLEIGFEEYLFGDGVCVVEWGELVRELLPEETLHISILKGNEDSRELVFSDPDFVKELEE